ncbi:hypothetical protein [Neomesorhizobium albiziae]|nr:hypothetical protein [Mesorhizobium albiziae]
MRLEEVKTGLHRMVNNRHVSKAAKTQFPIALVTAAALVAYVVRLALTVG